MKARDSEGNGRQAKRIQREKERRKMKATEGREGRSKGRVEATCMNACWHGKGRGQNEVSADTLGETP